MNDCGDPAIGPKGNGFQQLFLRINDVNARRQLAVRFIKQKGTAKNYRPRGYAGGHGFSQCHGIRRIQHRRKDTMLVDRNFGSVGKAITCVASVRGRCRIFAHVFLRSEISQRPPLSFPAILVSFGVVPGDWCRLLRHLPGHAFVLQPPVRRIAFPFFAGISDVSVRGYGDQRTRFGDLAVTPITLPVAAGIIEITVFRNAYGIAGRAALPETAIARPAASVTLQKGIHRNRNRDTALIQHAKSVLAIPPSSNRRVHTIGVERNGHQGATCVNLAIGTIAFPTVSAIRSLGRMSVRRHLDDRASGALLTIAMIAVPARSESRIHGMRICRHCGCDAGAARFPEAKIALPPRCE